jgi:hypothetical protein
MSPKPAKKHKTYLKFFQEDKNIPINLKKKKKKKKLKNEGVSKCFRLSMGGIGAVSNRGSTRNEMEFVSKEEIKANKQRCQNTLIMNLPSHMNDICDSEGQGRPLH